MPKRDRGKPQSRGSAPSRSRATRRRAGRRPARTRGALLLLLMLALAAFVAPSGQASAAGERSSAEREALSAAKTAEKEARTAATKAQRESEKAARKAQREAELAAARAKRAAERAAKKAKKEAERADKRHNDNLHGEVRFHCTSVEWTFMSFPEDASNTVSQELTFNHEVTKRTKSTFTFEGSTATMTMPINGPPGHYMIDAWSRWDTNGLKGNFDIRGSVTCAAVPALTIVKRQRIAGGAGAYTTSTLPGQVGQTVEYEIAVTNTGNVPLTLSDFTDTHCGTVSGPLGGDVLPVGAKTEYTCTHVLSEGGSYVNEATVTGTPPEGEGTPVTLTSKPVVVEVPVPAAPAFSVEKLQKIAGGTGSYTTSTLSGQTGQTVDYEIVVRNTGNVALTLASFSDERCEAATVSGGPVGGILAAGASTNYTCSHVLDEADQAAGSYSNTVTLTGTPPQGDGGPIAQGSNTVVVEVSPAGSNNNGGGGGEEHHEPTPGGNSTTSNSSSSTNASSGVLSSTVNQSQSGVLAFASASVPTLTGPEGCVRKSFHVSIRSAGVQSVTFYLDGHRLKTLTAKNARKGLLTIEIDPAKLKVGAHKLVARITMAHSASTKATVASRKVTILRCHSAVVTPKFTG
jgi:uncharacterized repeat protein (TIGR01451 family)